MLGNICSRKWVLAKLFIFSGKLTFSLQNLIPKKNKKCSHLYFLWRNWTNQLILSFLSSKQKPQQSQFLLREAPNWVHPHTVLPWQPNDNKLLLFLKFIGTTRKPVRLVISSNLEQLLLHCIQKVSGGPLDLETRSTVINIGTNMSLPNLLRHGKHTADEHIFLQNLQ